MTTENSDKQQDLSRLSRTRLIQGAFEAISRKETHEAQMYFGAAIRKAKRIRLWDVEAEYYKFVTLYLGGEYNEALKRCIECLDGLKLMTDFARTEGVALPQDAVAERLEQALVRTMIMRRATFLDLVKHYWQTSLGEFYILKRPRPLIEAIFQAWNDFSRQDLHLRYDLMKNELSIFSSYLQTKYEAATDLIDDDSDSPNSADNRKDRPEREMPEDSPSINFLEGALARGFMKLTSEEIDKLLSILAASRSEREVALIAELTAVLGPRSRRPYFIAFKSSPAFQSKSFSDPKANLFLEEARAYFETITEEIPG